MISLKVVIDIATQIYLDNYSDADVLLLCGSVVRGEHTKTSDLDLVVLYSSLPNAFRDSYICEGWPIEAFVHDYQTLHYFFKHVDQPTGEPSLMQMVAEGIEIPGPCALSDRAKTLAQDILLEGPPAWGQKELAQSRYTITNLLEDLKGAEDGDEQQAILARLYEQVAKHYLRSRQLWSAKGKWIPRRLKEVDASFASKFLSSMRHAFQGKGIEEVLAVIENELDNVGGQLFEGYRLDAPTEWREKSSE